jgi:hypothetical protein
MYLADDGKLVRFARKPYGHEKQLQDLLSTFPELLLVGLHGPNNNGRSKWMRVRYEFPLNDGNGSSLSAAALYVFDAPTFTPGNKASRQNPGSNC